MKLRCLGDFVELRQGLAINKGSAHLVSDTQDITYCYPLLRIADMMDSNFSKFVSKDVNSSVIANPQDIIYTRTGQIGLAFRGMQGVVHNNSFIVSLKTDELEKDYLYTVLNSNFVKKQANSQAKNSVQPDLTHTMFKSIVIPVPDSREEQNRISKIINNINQKIQTNIQINQELEAMAKTLYDYWFVQFDFPGQNGNPYKSSGGKMVYNPELKREIPEGWGVDSLWNIANFYNGLAMQKYRPDTNGDDYLPVIKIREMMNGFSKDTEKARLDIPIEAVVERGDILFSWSATLEVIIWGKEKGALNQHIFKVTSDTYPKSFIYFELKSYLKVFKAIAELRKTTMGHITQDHLKQAKIVVPPIELISKLDDNLQPIMLKQQILENQNQELIQLRDWLLPMLMNGQVKVEKE